MRQNDAHQEGGRALAQYLLLPDATDADATDADATHAKDRV
jgi:hypothetical protein